MSPQILRPVRPPAVVAAALVGALAVSTSLSAAEPPRLVPVVVRAAAYEEVSPYVAQRPTVADTAPSLAPAPPAEMHYSYPLPPTSPPPTIVYGPATAVYAASGAPASTPYDPSRGVIYPPSSFVQQAPYAPYAASRPITVYRAPAPLPAPQVARGLYGQPVIHVPGQPLRNALRYLTP